MRGNTCNASPKLADREGMRDSFLHPLANCLMSPSDCLHPFPKSRGSPPPDLGERYRALLAAMPARGRGVIVHVSSVQRPLSIPEPTIAYATAKAALTTTASRYPRRSAAGRASPQRCAGLDRDRSRRGDGAAVGRAGRHGLLRRRAHHHAVAQRHSAGPAGPEKVADLIAFVGSPGPASITASEHLIDGRSVRRSTVGAWLLPAASSRRRSHRAAAPPARACGPCAGSARPAASPRDPSAAR